jgi:hypothetical protein
MTISGTSLLADPPIGAHIVYPYTDEARVVEAVSLYASSGLMKGEGIVLVMTYPHCELVQERLIADGFDLPALKKSGQFICADAARTLSSFMNGSVPNENKFRYVIGEMIERAKASGGETSRTVRAFGEMVSLLFVEDPEAALRLEELWNDLLKTEQMCLLCTYHLTGGNLSLQANLCNAHSHYLA